MKRISELIGITLIAMAIGFVTVVLVGACSLLIPFRWAIDAAAERKKKLCFRCAELGMDRESVMQLIYYRPPGVHRCSRCKTSYTVEKHEHERYSVPG